MLLTSLILVAGSSTPSTAPPPAATRQLEQARSQRATDNPLSQTVLQPIQPTACLDDRAGCRHIDFFDIRANKAVYRLQINADLDYVDNGVLTLFPGESVVVRLESAGAGPARMTAVKGGLASETDKADGAVVASPGAVAAMSADPAGMAAIAAPGARVSEVSADQVRFAFLQTANQEDSVLRVDNGVGQILGYRALMRTMTGSTEPTDVCQVMAGKLGYEHWSYPVTTLILGQMQKLPPEPARLPACQ